MTVLSFPADYSSVHDDLIYTVYDAHVTDSTTYPNYKYISDVYVGTTLVARLRKIQDPSTGVGIFNIGQVVRNYLTTTFNPSANVLVSQTLTTNEFNLPITVKFGEEYNFVSYLELATKTGVTVFNNYNPRLIGATSSLISKTDKIASDRPFTGQVLSSSNFYFVPYFPTTTASVSVVVTPDVGSSYSTSFTPVALDMKVLNIAPGALNALQAGTITTNTKYYTVQIGGQTIRMEVICEPIYDTYALHFLNKYSGFETKLFSKLSRTTYQVEKKDFSRLPYTVDSSGIVSYKNANGVYNERRSVYASQYSEKLTVNSDFLTDVEYSWLSDLVFSPMVYVEDGSYFFPVVISESNYEPKKSINDELTNLTLSIQYGQTLNTQFR